MEACLYFIYYRLGMDKCDKLAIFLSGYEYFVKHYKSFFDFLHFSFRRVQKAPAPTKGAGAILLFILYRLNR